MARQHLNSPRGTSWAAVLGGWIASVGAAALIAPAVATLLSGNRSSAVDIAAVVPVVIGLIVSYLIGGYVAGSMAAYKTSWHGLMTAFFGLFIVLVALLLGLAADRGYLAGSGIRSLTDLFPGVQGLNLQNLTDALTFGAIIGFLATIFAGWLGGLLAPTRYVPVPVEVAAATEVTPAAEVTPVAEVTPAAEADPAPREPAVKREARPFRLFPAAGRKGGEPVAAHERVERVGPDDERERPREARAEPE